jgi:hypothetical protein
MGEALTIRVRREAACLVIAAVARCSRRPLGTTVPRDR